MNFPIEKDVAKYINADKKIDFIIEKQLLCKIMKCAKFFHTLLPFL